jgi:AraC family transcriptional regulator of adaptative response / DNA-3-methyladenine glycosylase II
MGYHEAVEPVELDWRVCSRARLARDTRFDGKFFIGVRSTKVYCRPTCPARTSKEENVLYFATAAAAAEAGFRPCLRCRPECSPGTLACTGTRNTVARALRLIGESGLEDGGVEALAERLGVGSRHLRRLFLRHLGATPTCVAQTRRLHFAKKLIDETRLPMTQVAIASGFGCVRTFNECIRKVYQRTPRQIRRLTGRGATQDAGQYIFHLHFRPPYNWKRALEFLALRATAGVEAVEDGRYRRSLSLKGNHGFFEVSPSETGSTLTVRVDFGEPSALFFVIDRIRMMFDLDSDWAVVAKTLRNDATLAQLVDAESGLRVPGCWSDFELTVRAILGQQNSFKAAATLAGRVVKACGQPFAAANGLTHLFPTADILADSNLANAGVPRCTAATLRTFARAVCDGHIQFQGIVDTSDFSTRLREIPGIGKWMAQYVAMCVLRDPDAFPSDDLALLRAMGERSADELEKRSEVWRPWRSYAAMLLWEFAGNALPRSRMQDGRAARSSKVLPLGDAPFKTGLLRCPCRTLR